MSIFNKKIITTFNIKNPINFCSNKLEHTKNLIENQYVGHCWAGSFILSIKELNINDISGCSICKTNTSGEGIINVKFTAEVIMFKHMDILIGVEIVHNQTMILGLYESLPKIIRAIVSIPPTSKHLSSIPLTKSIETLSIGQKVPIRIIDANHSPMAKEATIFGTLLVCDKIATIYKLQGVLNSSAKQDLLPLLTAIQVELLVRSTMHDKFLYFEKNLYSYKEKEGKNIIIKTEGYEDWIGPPVVTEKNIINLLEFINKATDTKQGLSVTGYWSRSLSIYRSSPMVKYTEESSEVYIEEGNILSVFIRFLKNILDFLMAIRQMSDLYNSPEMIKSHKNIWESMQAVQVVNSI